MSRLTHTQKAAMMMLAGRTLGIGKLPQVRANALVERGYAIHLRHGLTQLTAKGWRYTETGEE